MVLEVEFYKEGGMYCAYIGDGSGYKITADTVEDLAEQVGGYILDCPEDYLFDEEVETEEE